MAPAAVTPPGNGGALPGVPPGSSPGVPPGSSPGQVSAPIPPVEVGGNAPTPVSSHDGKGQAINPAGTGVPSEDQAGVVDDWVATPAPPLRLLEPVHDPAVVKSTTEAVNRRNGVAPFRPISAAEATLRATLGFAVDVAGHVADSARGMLATVVDAAVNLDLSQLGKRGFWDQLGRELKAGAQEIGEKAESIARNPSAAWDNMVENSDKILAEAIPTLTGIGRMLGSFAGRGINAISNLRKTPGKTVPKVSNSVTAYRAQGRPLISVDEAGNVSIARPLGRQREGVAVHVGFDKGRAKVWITEKGRTEVVQFEVDKSFLDRLRQTAKPEKLPPGVARDRSLPWRVDIDWPDQYAIPPSMLDDFEKAIIPGTGRVTIPGG